MVERYNYLFRIASEMNDFIDFVIAVTYGDLDESENIINAAWDSYWEEDDACSMTVAEWISLSLDNSDMEFDYIIYFKEEN